MIDEVLRTYTQDKIRPLKKQRDRITKLYGELKDFLGEGNCFQTGSYPRFTAIRPVHDLDVFYIYRDGKTTAGVELALPDLAKRIEAEFSKVCSEKFTVEAQTHSVKLCFPENFSVDVVPAIETSLLTEDYGDPIYCVPVESTGNWIFSDPKGYKKLTKDIDELANKKLRYSIRLIKAWRKGCKDRDDEFKFKSFHIEQIMIEIFIENPDISIYDAIRTFYSSVSENLLSARFEDRAYTRRGETRYIDEYVNELTSVERDQILQLANAQFDLYESMDGVDGQMVDEDIKKTLDMSLLCKNGLKTEGVDNPRVFKPAGPHSV
jgi:hypothetical protein